MPDSSDSLVRSDSRSQELAYNNVTDRMKVELPGRGSDAAASGVVYVVSASGTDSIPVYLTSPIPVSVAVDIQSDSIKVFSASGTSDVPVYLVSDLDKNNDSVTSWNVSSSGTSDIPVYLTSPVEIDVHLSEADDTIRVYSASGSAVLETWVNNTITTVKSDPTSGKLISKRFSYNALGDVSTIKEALTTTASGASCKLSTFTYNSDNDVDYVVDSLGSW